MSVTSGSFSDRGFLRPDPITAAGTSVRGVLMAHAQ